VPPEETNTKRVLVVDDEDVLLSMIRRLLKKAGYEVVVAGSAESALEILSSQAAVDLLLTDIRMPKVSGAELAARMPRRDPPAIVFMSGASEETEEDLRKLGGRAFLKKPFRSADLLAVIEAGLR